MIGPSVPLAGGAVLLARVCVDQQRRGVHHAGEGAPEREAHVSTGLYAGRHRKEGRRGVAPIGESQRGAVGGREVEG